MNLSLRILDKKKIKYKEACKLYQNAFPADEKAPLRMIKKKANKSNVDWWGIYDDNIWVGFFYVISYNKLSYVFYFAIADNMRGKGYGSKALELLKDTYKENRIFLAIEQIDENADNYEERVNRKRFYQRCGFEELSSKLKEGKVTYELLGIGGNVSKEEYKKLINSWLSFWIRGFVTMEILDK